jgi:hypothetical protein
MRRELSAGHIPSRSACGTKDVHTALMDVRFEKNNGHDGDVTGCLLMTLSGHLHSIAGGSIMP